MNDSVTFPIVIAFGLSGIAIDMMTHALPKPATEQFFELRNITAIRVGNTALLTVDRSIHAPIDMSWSIRVMEETGEGWMQFCTAQSGVFQYRPESVLPRPVTLDWWTSGQCPTLPDGPARIVTTWTPRRAGLDPVTSIVRVE